MGKVSTATRSQTSPSSKSSRITSAENITKSPKVSGVENKRTTVIMSHAITRYPAPRYVIRILLPIRCLYLISTGKSASSLRTWDLGSILAGVFGFNLHVFFKRFETLEWKVRG